MHRDLTTDVISPSLLKRLSSHIHVTTEDDCWEWQASRTPPGYGRTHVFDPVAGKNRGEYAHRLAYIAENGVDIPAGMVIMHLCDNPPCCNPAHLRMGTYRDNTQDAIRKGRWRSACPQVDIDRWKDQLVAVYQRGGSVQAIARMAGVSQYAIRDALIRYGIYRYREDSDHPGVWWEPTRRRWRVQVSVNSRAVYVGRYLDKDEALRVHAEATQRLTKRAS